MSKKEAPVSVQNIAAVESWLKQAINNPPQNPAVSVINRELQSWFVTRATHKPDQPLDKPNATGTKRSYGQRACSIINKRLYVGTDPWEKHEDIENRSHHSEEAIIVSGELFYLRGLPKIPVIRCDSYPLSHVAKLIKSKGYILLDAYYQLI